MSDPIPDPFTTPVAIEVDPGSEIDRAIRSLLPPDLATAPNLSGAVLISARVTGGSAVQASIVGPPCARCGSRVWLAPSSRRVATPFRAAVCVECVGAALARMQPTRGQA